ncbi:hypothetical protein HanXRQr2_Chr13g0599431 [Helianthus annuus]|uniref:Uncharacterized protein n=1 Tax=Helianthus annuus TaxID=4232 RepID=A0A251SU24_HELAN|nr:hypothetical protein HanXRQr2_Chr13g0599431 [Helianthus annuus]KAJ0850174.1 hypothetical protein HanPSC8_Chr13g0577531 [Helianthus annuus]
MILSNRQSDACSKESKIRYTSKLERKVKTLQNKANNALYTSDNAPGLNAIQFLINLK